MHEDSTPAAVVVEGLSHRYPAARRRRRHPRQDGSGAPAAAPPAALDGLSLQIEQGELFGLLGPNGSGKSTLLRILSTILPPQTGSVRMMGRSLPDEAAQVRQALGVVFQNPSLDLRLTARENLLHQGHLYGLSGTLLSRRIADLLDEFGLADRADDDAGSFSGGMRRRLELARALIHGPSLLLMDEPSTGLDPGARGDLWRRIAQLRRQRRLTVILSTHLMGEAEHCDRLAIIHQGRLVALDTPAGLKAAIRGDVVTLEPLPGTDSEALRTEIADRLAPWPEGKQPTLLEGRIHFEKPDGPAVVPQLAAAVADRVRSISVGKPNLDDVFLHLTGQRLWDEASGES